MKLLILTQKVDINDDVLGFFHGWLKGFAEHCERIAVICLMEGEHDLPDNVKILSLGKEKIARPASLSEAGGNWKLEIWKRFIYALRFFKYIREYRREYDKVFVHMNAEYAVLGGWVWKLWGKPIYLWNNHRSGNLSTKIAQYFVKKIFYTSPFANFARHKKAVQMPVGIDSKLFSKDRNIERERNTVLYLGRISPIKNIEALIKAASILKENKIAFKAKIVGSPSDYERDKKYFQMLKDLARTLKLENFVEFTGNVPNFKTPEIYNRNNFFINLTNSGSLDKTTLEAIMCGCVPLACNQSFREIFPSAHRDRLIFRENDADDLAQKLIGLMPLAPDERDRINREIRAIAAEKHSLERLMKELMGAIKQ